MVMAVKKSFWKLFSVVMIIFMEILNQFFIVTMTLSLFIIVMRIMVIVIVAAFMTVIVLFDLSCLSFCSLSPASSHRGRHIPVLPYPHYEG